MSKRVFQVVCTYEPSAYEADLDDDDIADFLRSWFGAPGIVSIDVDVNEDGS